MVRRCSYSYPDTLLASFDALLVTCISNVTVLVSLLQDCGDKKTKYKDGTEHDGFHVNVGSLQPGERLQTK
jgi:hypothetical protein